jgi:hypothetical protein
VKTLGDRAPKKTDTDNPNRAVIHIHKFMVSAVGHQYSKPQDFNWSCGQ